jgi:hypothetical protein
MAWPSKEEVRQELEASYAYWKLPEDQQEALVEHIRLRRKTDELARIYGTTVRAVSPTGRVQVSNPPLQEIKMNTTDSNSTEDWSDPLMDMSHVTSPQQAERYAQSALSQAERLEARTKRLRERADKFLEYAADERAKRQNKFGNDIHPDNTVIRFRKRFPNGTVNYRYAAIKADGLWFTTGPKAPKGFTWEQLTTWMGDGVERIEILHDRDNWLSR